MFISVINYIVLQMPVTSVASGIFDFFRLIKGGASLRDSPQMILPGYSTNLARKDHLPS